MNNRRTTEPRVVANDLYGLREQVAHATSASCVKYPSDARIQLGPDIDSSVLDEIATDLRSFGRIYKVDVEDGVPYLIIR